MQTIQRVAVMGAGTMGSRIAAHFANAGVACLLLDLPSSTEDSNQIAKRGVENALKQRPTAFFTPDCGAMIETGNFDDDLPRIRECQWVIEAVAENLEIKRSLWSRIEKLRHPDAILSTNTSGIRLADISRDFPSSFRTHFLGTHFFNPPRYLHLLEIIPGEETEREIVEFVAAFGEQRLGKGIVRCKDTPDFIGNRIGCFYTSAVQRAMIEGDYTIEEADALTGPLIGIPNSASFRLMDIIGLDIWAQVARNVYTATRDQWTDWFRPTPYMQKMLENGWLGEKTGQGFYKRVGPEKQIHVLNWKTLEYHPAEKVRFESVEAVQKKPDLGARVRALLDSSDRAGVFLWKVFASVFAYSGSMIPEISDRIVEIDRFNNAFNRQDVEAVASLLTEDTIFEDTSPAPDGKRVEGKADVTAFWREWSKRNAGAQFEAEDIIVSGNRAVVRWIYRKVRNGQPWHLRGADVFTVREGKVAAKLAYVKG